MDVSELAGGKGIANSSTPFCAAEDAKFTGLKVRILSQVTARPAGTM